MLTEKIAPRELHLTREYSGGPPGPSLRSRCRARDACAGEQGGASPGVHPTRRCAHWRICSRNGGSKPPRWSRRMAGPWAASASRICWRPAGTAPPRNTTGPGRCSPPDSRHRGPHEAVTTGSAPTCRHRITLPPPAAVSLRHLADRHESPNEATSRHTGVAATSPRPGNASAREQAMTQTTSGPVSAPTVTTPRFPGQQVVINGNGAVAQVMGHVCGGVIGYPITPSTEISELYEAFRAERRHQRLGQAPVLLRARRRAFGPVRRARRRAHRRPVHLQRLVEPGHPLRHGVALRHRRQEDRRFRASGRRARRLQALAQRHGRP